MAPLMGFFFFLGGGGGIYESLVWFDGFFFFLTWFCFWFDGPVVVLGYIRVVVCSLYYYLVVREK